MIGWVSWVTEQRAVGLVPRHLAFRLRSRAASAEPRAEPGHATLRKAQGTQSVAEAVAQAIEEAHAVVRRCAVAEQAQPHLGIFHLGHAGDQSLGSVRASLGLPGAELWGAHRCAEELEISIEEDPTAARVGVNEEGGGGGRFLGELSRRDHQLAFAQVEAEAEGSTGQRSRPKLRPQPRPGHRGAHRRCRT